MNNEEKQVVGACFLVILAIILSWVLVIGGVCTVIWFIKN